MKWHVMTGISEAMLRLLRILAVAWAMFGGALAAAERSPDDTELPDAKPVPALQVVPLPYHQASFRLNDVELTRYHFGPSLIRPFLYPLRGPEDRSLTQMDQPTDPHGHRHHTSVWISHVDVNGVNFWGDDGEGRIVHLRVEEYLDDGEDNQGASILVSNAWRDAEDHTLLLERRRVTVRPIDRRRPSQWGLLIDLELSPPDEKPVTLGETAFGIIGVRLARSIGVDEGGGRILNSEGQRDEAEAFRQNARWVDYSGPVTNTARGGITLMDHPGNPNHPAAFHVRDAGWMGASLTFHEPITIERSSPLQLRYGLWMHDDVPDRQTLDSIWSTFADLPFPPLTPAGEHHADAP
jgi:hypothetical protein